MWRRSLHFSIFPQSDSNSFSSMQKVTLFPFVSFYNEVCFHLFFKQKINYKRQRMKYASTRLKWENEKP